MLSVAIQQSVCSAFFYCPAELVLDVHKKWSCHPVGSVGLLQTAAESEWEDEKFEV